MHVPRTRPDSFVLVCARPDSRLFLEVQFSHLLMHVSRARPDSFILVRTRPDSRLVLVRNTVLALLMHVSRTRPDSFVLVHTRLIPDLFW
jgi:hypothetical protein